MIKVIVGLFVLLAAISNAFACSSIEELKPDLEKLVNWAQDHCKKSKDLTDADLAKVKGCYTKFISPQMTTDKQKEFDGLCQKIIFGDPDIKNICKDEKLREKIKKEAMKKAAKAASCAKEMAKECDKYQKAFQDCTKCIQE